MLSKHVRKVANDSERGHPASSGYTNYYSSYNSLAKEDLKMWVLPDDMDEKLLKNYLHRCCRASSSFNYKIYFPGEFVNPCAKSMEETQLAPSSIFVFELLQTGEDWCFHNKKHFIKAKCDNCKLLEELKFMCSCQVTLYCSLECKNKDKYYHRQRCDRDC